MRPLALVLALAAAVVSGQDRPASTVVPPPPGQPAEQPPAYTYNPEGRRDPFVSLLRRANDGGRKQGKASDGVAGFLVSEIELKGIMQSRGTNVALVLGPDSKTYIVRVNDRLLDGNVRAITADTIVLMQDVNDPLSLTKQREVRKVLRAVVDVK
ncbi:MAG: pilus assembly protein PilP [Acidobacteria bacterium]|nr:pilus assembly protein PilP [Acidobacteriota bacterium]